MNYKALAQAIISMLLSAASVVAIGCILYYIVAKGWGPLIFPVLLLLSFMVIVTANFYKYFECKGKII